MSVYENLVNYQKSLQEKEFDSMMNTILNLLLSSIDKNISLVDFKERIQNKDEILNTGRDYLTFGELENFGLLSKPESKTFEKSISILIPSLSNNVIFEN